MRLFVAIFLPDPILSQLEGFKREQKSIEGLRWIPRQSLHITLKFIGEVEPFRLPSIQAALNRVNQSKDVFRLFCEGGGVFPNEKSPRVFWTGLKGDVTPLSQLAQAIEAEFESLGFPSENRRFSPHLTVARSRADASAEAGDVSGKFFRAFASYKSPEFVIHSFHLVQSHLRGTGSHYEIIETYEMRMLERS